MTSKRAKANVVLAVAVAVAVGAFCLVAPAWAQSPPPNARLSTQESVAAQARESFRAGTLDRAATIARAREARQDADARQNAQERRLLWVAAGLLTVVALWAWVVFALRWLRDGGASATAAAYEEDSGFFDDFHGESDASLPAFPSASYRRSVANNAARPAGSFDTPPLGLAVAGTASLPPRAWKSFGAAVAGRDSGAGWRRGFESSPPEGDSPASSSSWSWPPEEPSGTLKPIPKPSHQGALVASQPLHSSERPAHAGRMVASIQRAGWETLPTVRPNESLRSFERRFTEAMQPPPDGVAPTAGDIASIFEPAEPVIESKLKLRLQEGSIKPINDMEKFMVTDQCPAVQLDDDEDPTSPML